LRKSLSFEKNKNANETVDDFERRDPMVAALMVGLAYYAMENTFRGISGGPMNPAVSLAQIMW